MTKVLAVHHPIIRPCVCFERRFWSLHRAKLPWGAYCDRTFQSVEGSDSSASTWRTDGSTASAVGSAMQA